MAYFVLSDRKNEGRKNVRMGGFRSLQAAIRRAIGIGDAEVISESGQYVMLVQRGKVTFDNPSFG